MGIADRKERERESKKSQILFAAMDIYLSEGIEKVSVRNIAERIEMSPAAMYSYYRDKDELFYALYNFAFGKFNEEQAKFAAIADAYERLYQGARAYVRWGLDNPKLYDMMFIIEVPMQVIEEEKCVDLGIYAFENLRKNVAESISAGALKIKDDQLGATMIWNYLHGIVAAITKKRVLVPQEQVEKMVEALVDSFFVIIRK